MLTVLLYVADTASNQVSQSMLTVLLYVADTASNQIIRFLELMYTLILLMSFEVGSKFTPNVLVKSMIWFPHAHFLICIVLNEHQHK